MTKQLGLGGSFTLPGTSMSLKRMGYGAMQLAGPQVYGPPRDMDAAIAVLREAVGAGINHIDTSDFLRPACDQPDHQTGASSLSGWTGDRYQSWRPAAEGQIVGARAFAAGADRCSP